ncbi:hypothetical protein PR202_ga20076 [Eleusine coracana subsp. coracana]|uniref:NAP1-related protein 2 n=1 Tax=Eleusine coracana subsp. coracana TaxID=191504 RepID=A0AAV5CVU0_ELECO|nr:hypothetical protein QOZ80_4AG0314990 [Eleusine coracana subsp. coracana]GJN02698.1 hypothetical protein PR202_ga20076 [Eleusine coracana subsp. coracana]
MLTAQEKGKKPRTDDAEGEGGEPIDAALLVSIEKLQQIQDEIDKVNEEADNKVLEVEKKYSKIRRPVYIRRNEVIQKIPDFWLTTFLSHPTLGELLTEDDQKIFKHLESIDVVESEDTKLSCSITLTFSYNPYFEDKKLTKTYSMSDDGKISVKTTSIKWKEGMDIVNGKTCMRDGDKRLLVDDSFFTWFSDKNSSRLVYGEMDEVADIIKEELWPNPLKFFNNGSEDEFVEEEDEGSDEEEDQDGSGEEGGDN